MTTNDCQQLLAKKDERIKAFLLELYERDREASVGVSVRMPERFAAECVAVKRPE